MYWRSSGGSGISEEEDRSGSKNEHDIRNAE
jgi:hypothetical protein